MSDQRDEQLAPPPHLGPLTVYEGECPKGGPHQYGAGLTICQKCGGNRLARDKRRRKNRWNEPFD